jgi:hypothetical protein
MSWLHANNQIDASNLECDVVTSLSAPGLDPAQLPSRVVYGTSLKAASRCRTPKTERSSAMDQPVLTDPNIFPTSEVLSSHLGRALPAFNQLFEYNHAQYPDFVETWRFYNDGKQWLMNVSKKKKTVFWLSVGKGFFRTSFYINPKKAHLIPGSDIPQELKDQYKQSEGAYFRPITVVIKTKKNVDDYRKMLGLKLSAL